MFFAIILFIVGIASGVSAMILMNYMQRAGSENAVKNAQEMANITTVPGKAISTGGDIAETNPYWQFIKMELIKADLSELRKINPEATGWVRIAGTGVDMPFVQTDNNDFYINHSFNKSSNGDGWIFLDSRNDRNLSDSNNILYAHGNSKSMMFDKLREVLSNGWLSDRANFVIRTSTDEASKTWQVFSIYKEKGTEHLVAKFGTDDDFADYIKKVLDKSKYGFSTPVSSIDRILTISTKVGDDEYAVMHAKLIKSS